jgi:hypothetical protein
MNKATKLWLAFICGFVMSAALGVVIVHNLAGTPFVGEVLYVVAAVIPGILGGLVVRRCVELSVGRRN